LTRYTLLLLCSPLFAQPGTSLLSRADFIQNWKTSKEFTIAVAEKMPEEFYGYKANAEEMTFAGLMLHIANANEFRFAQISEDKAPAVVAPRYWPKTAVINRLRESFDYCIGKLGTITDEQFKKRFQVGWYERPEASGAQILLGMYVHTAHHRAQAEVYMRANNIKPPDYRP